MHLKSPQCKVLHRPDVKDTLHQLHANYVLVPADKAANNVIVVDKKYYIDNLVKELGRNNVNSNSPTYITEDSSLETIVRSHNAFKKKDESVIYTCIKVTRAKGYFTHDINGSGDNMYNTDNIFKMETTFCAVWKGSFPSGNWNSSGTNCALLIAYFFLYSYENEFLHNMIRCGHRRLAR